MSSAPQFADPESPNQLTIEQLAAKSGMSVRNIRAHQARGLLDPPEVRARVGYYGSEHLEQLRLVRDLQEDGFNLGAIKRLLEDTQGTAERLQRFGRPLSSFVEPFVHKIWKPFAQADMPAERWPEIEDAVERLGPVASEALMAIFQRRLGAELEGAFEEITRRVAERTSDTDDE